MSIGFKKRKPKRVRQAKARAERKKIRQQVAEAELQREKHERFRQEAPPPIYASSGLTAEDAAVMAALLIGRGRR